MYMCIYGVIKQKKKGSNQKRKKSVFHSTILKKKKIVVIILLKIPKTNKEINKNNKLAYYKFIDVAPPPRGGRLFVNF